MPNLGIDLAKSLLFTGLPFAAELLQQPGLAGGRHIRKLRSDEVCDIRITLGHSRWLDAASPVDGPGRFRKFFDRQFRVLKGLKDAPCDTRIQRGQRSTEAACERAIARKEIVLPHWVLVRSPAGDDRKVISEVRSNQYARQVLGDCF